MRAIFKEHSSAMAGMSQKQTLKKKLGTFFLDSKNPPAQQFATFQRLLTEARETGLSIDKDDVIRTIFTTLINIPAYDRVYDILGQRPPEDWKLEEIKELCAIHYTNVICARAQHNNPPTEGRTPNRFNNRFAKAKGEPRGRLHAVVKEKVKTDFAPQSPWRTSCNCPGKEKNQHITSCKFFAEYMS